MVDLQRHATAEMAAQFHDLFVNRRAYTLQSMRPHPETGRHYYFRPKSAGRAASSRAGPGNIAATPGWRTHASACIRSIRRLSGQSGLPSTPTTRTPSSTC